ncbi:MFS transporter [Streptomyces sp. SID3343]|uniref:MFS transporter n=1 Tax=Streptomyces sp. SID3343 TaxID=2690260 RepID=UPI00136B1591|nr:MFS transporter [Streptomyces sp. SID3343]MYW00037.1 MFS transporter [Streptomyces sp. SID3343]
MVGVRDPFRRAQFAIAALFCSLGFQYGTWASRIPTLKSRLDLSEAHIGLMLMATGVGAAASFPLLGMLMKRLGSRRLATWSAVCLALLLPALAAAPNYPVALLVLLCDGVAVGCLNVSMNAQGAALEVEFERTTMAKLHATFSAGALLAALLASGVNAFTSSPATHFGVAGALILVLIGYTRSGLLTHDRPAKDPEPATADTDPAAPAAAVGTKTRRTWRLPATMTLWMGCAMAFGTVTEGAMNDWSALYLEDVVDAPSELAPMGIAVVSVMMVLARIFADGWRTRWGDGVVVRVGSTLAGAGLALALLVGGVAPTLIGFACVGLGVAAVTPCVYVTAARQGPDALALVATMGTVGLLAGPAIIGFIAGATSLVWGMGAVASAAILVALCATRIRWTATPFPETT